MNDFTKFQTSFIASNNHIINTESGIHTHIDLPDTVSPPSVEITNNTIKSDRWGITIASLNLDTSSTHIGNLKVVGNTIDVLGEYIDGCLFISGVNCSSGAPGIISNNMLSMRNDGSEFYNVLEIKHSNELKIYHNSISSFGNAALTWRMLQLRLILKMYPQISLARILTCLTTLFLTQPVVN